MMRYLLLFLMCGAAWGQSRGYFFIAPGGRTFAGRTDAVYSVGGGGELGLARGVGAGVELQGVVPARGAANNSFGIFSLNGYYHPLQARRETKFDPFATVGYSLAFRTDTANLWNFGGGLNYWFRDRIAVMVEVRDHPWSSGRFTAHYWGIRAGLSFR